MITIIAVTEKGKMMDRYEFMSMVDDMFKECNTEEEIRDRHVQLRTDLYDIFRQNLALKGCE